MTLRAECPERKEAQCVQGDHKCLIAVWQPVKARVRLSEGCN
jgi:hypothetical protein